MFLILLESSEAKWGNFCVSYTFGGGGGEREKKGEEERGFVCVVSSIHVTVTVKRLSLPLLLVQSLCGIPNAFSAWSAF